MSICGSCENHLAKCCNGRVRSNIGEVMTTRLRTRAGYSTPTPLQAWHWNGEGHRVLILLLCCAIIKRCSMSNDNDDTYSRLKSSDGLKGACAQPVKDEWEGRKAGRTDRGSIKKITEDW